MAELTTLARPYAKAAFDQAKAEKSLASWSKSLALMVAIAEHKNVLALFSSPSLTFQEKSDTLIKLTGDELSTPQQNFISVLAENNRLGLLKNIHELFELYKANQEKSVDVDVQSAYEISPELSTKLTASLTKTLDRAVSLHTTINSDLIGGVVIRAGDTVIDASVRGRLEKLTEALDI